MFFDVERIAKDGTAKTTIKASFMASSRLFVTVNVSGKIIPGKKRLFSRSVDNNWAKDASNSHITTLNLLAKTKARVFPQEPAPNTATLLFILFSLPIVIK